MLVSSRLQGLHQVAKKAMIIGLPLLEIVSVCTVLPSMSLRITLGRRSCADAAKLTNNKQRDKNNLFIVFNYIAATKIRKKYDKTKNKQPKKVMSIYLNRF